MHPVLQHSISTPSPTLTCGGGSTAAEVCGRTTAECAAVWCCCPFGLVNLLVLAVYKVPAGICRRALRNRRKRKLRKSRPLPPSVPQAAGTISQMQTRRSNRCGCGDCREPDIAAVHPLGSGDETKDDEDDAAAEAYDDFLELKIEGKEKEEEDDAVAELEKEMWNRFYGAGFWRSPSQRESISPSPRASFTAVYRTASQRGLPVVQITHNL